MREVKNIEIGIDSANKVTTGSYSMPIGKSKLFYKIYKLKWFARAYDEFRNRSKYGM